MNQRWYNEWVKEQKPRTYREWQRAGRHVMKGQKAIGRNREGIPVFNIDQTNLTVKRESEYYNPEWAYEEDEVFGYLFDDIGDR